ncbi:putative nucleic acid-binding protein, contains PIN domain [Nostoc sp. PCC 7524]|uniref:type II toxin-antitoxin system VapC family toxin n=1 Tax=Nostoc sp. (strain ATCC 29411 / PCC 7524) TaxID=28072 RepID=UPI00029F4A14|nr:PIN domain-containing protein [Nostoc sp. PCC 7524]AFY48369.1 putative nucleic acid-binding protein, contains PIN domain [Nostoc sp. PCC 7524]
MRKVFADTGYWIALLNPNDELNLKARSVTASLSANARIVTSEMVFTELLNAFSKQGSILKKTAISLINKSFSNPNIEIIPQTSELFIGALELYSQRLDQGWSHTDCASFKIMEMQNLSEALAYDKHFEQAGFIALLRY